MYAQLDDARIELSQQQSVILQQRKDITHLQNHIHDQALHITELKDKLAKLKASMAQKKKEAEHWCCRFRSQCYALQRTCISLADFAAKLSHAIDVNLPAACEAKENAPSRLCNLEITSKKNYDILSACLQKSKTHSLSLHKAPADSQKKLNAMSAWYRCSICSCSKAIKCAASQAESHSQRWNLYHNGAYTPVACQLSRVLVKAGCSLSRKLH